MRQWLIKGLVASLALSGIMGLFGCSSDQGKEQNVQDADMEQLAVSARQTMQAFGGELKQALLAGLGEGGPGTAMAVCRDRAPEIATSVSEQTGWQVARTSLKARNAQNVPDAWERKGLEKFEVQLAGGENPAQLEYYEIVEVEGQRVFRYLKAIPTSKLCLQCHGEDLAPEVSATIEELYPQDLATGFAEGEIRGAFSLKRPL